MILLITLGGQMLYAQEKLMLFVDGKSDFSIYVQEASEQNDRAAHILQDYLERATSWKLPIRYGHAWKRKALMIGFSETTFARDAFEIKVSGDKVYLDGGEKGLIYGIYRFIEEFIGARKWSVGREGTYVPKLEQLGIPKVTHIEGNPKFDFREVYFPIEVDPEYLEWHGLHNLEDLWGLWGHSFNKLLPPSVYFDEHPEYYSYYQGRRQPNQLCLSNEEVFEHVVNRFAELMHANPAAEYWS